MGQPKHLERKPRTPHNKCPVCDSGMRIRTSNLITPLFKEEKRQCINPDCGLSVLYEVTAARVLVPSAMDPSNAGLTIQPTPQATA